MLQWSVIFTRCMYIIHNTLVISTWAKEIQSNFRNCGSNTAEKRQVIFLNVALDPACARVTWVL